MSTSPDTAPPVAVVTGTAGGIGAAIADALATRGWAVAGLDMRADATSPCPGPPPDALT